MFLKQYCYFCRDVLDFSSQSPARAGFTSSNQARAESRIGIKLLYLYWFSN